MKMEITLQIIFNIITIFFSFFAIIFTYLNYRQTNRGVIKLDFVGYDKYVHDGKSKQDVRETNPFYVFVKNCSNVLIKKLKLKTVIIYKNKSFTESIQKLDYLNSGEKVTFTYLDLNFRKKFPELFESITNGRTTFITPKENLKFKVKFILTWSFFHKQLDEFDVEWRSYNLVKFESDDLYHKHCVGSYNKRNGFYIYKN